MRRLKQSRTFVKELPPTLRLIAITIKWGRVPQTWELAFIAKMKDLQKSGIRFDRVVKIALPRLFGEESEVLTSWVGKKNARNPERFVRSIHKMWGSSAHSVIISLDNLTDDGSLFVRKVEEPACKSLLDAIQKSDEARLMRTEPETPKKTPLETLAETTGETENPPVTALALCPPTMIQRARARGAL